MANRNFPNQYFAWYNDDQRLAILALDITSTGTGTRTTEKYDTFQDSGNLSGNITASKALITGSLKVGPDNVDVSNVEMEVGYSENLIGEHIKSGSRINVTSDSFASSSLFLYSANKGWEIATGKLTGMFEAGALVFRVNGSTTANPPLKLSGGGHVGIGMDKDVVPAKTLTVEGDISASGDIQFNTLTGNINGGTF